MAIWWDKQYPYVARLHVPTITLWQEYDAVIDEFVIMLKAVSYSVDIIATRETEYQKAGGTPHLQRAMQLILALPHLNRIVTVQPPGRTFANIVFRSSVRLQNEAMQQKFLYADSLASAYKLLSHG